MTDAPHPLPLPSFETFRTQMLAAGHDEVLVRPWAPGTVVERHTHPFAAEALVVEGEMWLAIEDAPAQHLRPGDRFRLAANQPHSERYGPEGATY
ncbi:MAG: cupin domain-containing protein [Burkholderiales bacterium]|nr:MAG: cupin domain-containing protein [Burkholderiales bacterium]